MGIKEAGYVTSINTITSKINIDSLGQYKDFCFATIKTDFALSQQNLTVT